MRLPEQLETLRSRKVWVCYPMIYDEKKHNGVGGYAKPPINPYALDDPRATVHNGKTNDPTQLATYEEAVAQIGKPARVILNGHSEPVDTTVYGVGVALGGTGVCGIDLDSVVERNAENDGYNFTEEAYDIMFMLKSYTEISPSGDGVHILFLGSLPDGIVKKKAGLKRDIFGTEKAEYQLFDSGYMTVTGDRIGGTLKECTELVAQIYEKYFREVEPVQELSTTRPSAAAGAPSVVSSGSGFTRERWLEDVRRLSDAELLERIFKSGSTGEKVKSLFGGDISGHNNNHSEADLALCALLYGFTDDIARTEVLFRASKLYRAHGKSRSYIDHTLKRAQERSKPLIGHIELTDADKRAYAKKKEAEERAAGKRYGDFLRSRARKRGVTK